MMMNKISYDGLKDETQVEGLHTQTTAIEVSAITSFKKETAKLVHLC
jgi:hypothetical protein